MSISDNASFAFSSASGASDASRFCLFSSSSRISSCSSQLASWSMTSCGKSSAYLDWGSSTMSSSSALSDGCTNEVELASSICRGSKAAAFSSNRRIPCIGTSPKSSPFLEEEEGGLSLLTARETARLTVKVSRPLRLVGGDCEVGRSGVCWLCLPDPKMWA